MPRHAVITTRLDLLDVLLSTPWQWHALFRQKKPEKRVKPNRQIIDDDGEGAKAPPLFLAVIHQIREKENTGWKWNEIHARTEPNPTQPQSSWNWNPRRIQFCQLQALASSPNYLSLSSPRRPEKPFSALCHQHQFPTPPPRRLGHSHRVFPPFSMHRTTVSYKTPRNPPAPTARTDDAPHTTRRWNSSPASLLRSPRC